MYAGQNCDFYHKVFSYNRFYLLLKFFHLVDKRTLKQPGQDGYDPTARFNPIVTHSNHQFRRHYTPKQQLSIDESLVGTKNKTQILQYMPKKHHHKWGIKLWMLCEVATGYVFTFYVYKGKTDGQADIGLSGQVVLTLMRMANYLNKGYHVFCDNFFTGVELVTELFDNMTYITGTIRRNRRGLSSLVKKKIQPGVTEYYRQG